MGRGKYHKAYFVKEPVLSISYLKSKMSTKDFETIIAGLVRDGNGDSLSIIVKSKEHDKKKDPGGLIIYLLEQGGF